jgi:hypothetical protein
MNLALTDATAIEMTRAQLRQAAEDVRAFREQRDRRGLKEASVRYSLVSLVLANLVARQG